MNMITAFFKSLPGFVHRNAGRIGLAFLAAAFLLTRHPALFPQANPFIPYIWKGGAALGGWSYGKAILNTVGLAQSEQDNILAGARDAQKYNSTAYVKTAAGTPDLQIIPRP